MAQPINNLTLVLDIYKTGYDPIAQQWVLLSQTRRFDPRGPISLAPVLGDDIILTPHRSYADQYRASYAVHPSAPVLAAVPIRTAVPRNDGFADTHQRIDTYQLVLSIQPLPAQMPHALADRMRATPPEPIESLTAYIAACTAPHDAPIDNIHILTDQPSNVPLFIYNIPSIDHVFHPALAQLTVCTAAQFAARAVAPAYRRGR